MSFTADRLLLFGATGDLAQRMLLPSLCALHDDKLIAPDLVMTAIERSDRLARLQRRVYRPLDRPWIPMKGSASADFDSEIDAELDVPDLSDLPDGAE